ncbi:MAG TPA: metallophosphoesterase [Acidimicrobiales bacterium]|jgi:predicted phosphodiesterase|nr:metallophosphoesterase [Acidimicrobiales bacterium]
MPGPKPAATRLEIFSVDIDSVQVTWAALGPGPVSITAADTRVELTADGGPGAVVLDKLPPGRALEVVVRGEGVRGGERRLTATTLSPPPGDEVARFATISDIHTGEEGFGYFHGIKERDDVEPYPTRSAAAAVDELTAWGAELLVVKGDITNKGVETEWAAVADVLGAAALPVTAVAGNHDVKHTSELDLAGGLTGTGVTTVEGTGIHDLPGARVVVVDSTMPDVHRGHVHAHMPAAHAALAEAAAEGRGAVIALHHQLGVRGLGVGWPPGLRRRESRDFLAAIAAANPHTLITSGHTHRHRRHEAGPVTATTVGSVKDYPGVWAGYVVHEGGIRQVVRRVARPDVIRWTERSGDTAFGAYRHWTPGRLSARCFALDWSG